MSVGTGRRAVAIGGGTGLPSVLGCLVDLGFETSAVVTMADDGGSSGKLRQQLGMLPPGDIRNCLVALSDEQEGLLGPLFQYRFPEGEGLAGHALGNLIIAALADITGSFPAAIEAAERYLNVRGHVYPSTLVDCELHGVDREGGHLSGQARLAVSANPLECVHLEPEWPEAYPPALEAISSADIIVLGPGSLYTSLIPNLLVAGVAEAICESSATRIYVCNVANMRGETGGLDAADHVMALAEHGLSGAIDLALVHEPCSGSRVVCDDDAGTEPVLVDEAILARIRAMGPDVIAENLADPQDPVRHSRSALCRTLEKVVV
ncbi:MAG: YvcK family protein [Coriobacteriia bacterium]|nr:YvcK family protein [Coriobacteriia bacterium]